MLQKVKDGFLYGLGFIAATIAITLVGNLFMLLIGLAVAVLSSRPV